MSGADRTRLEARFDAAAARSEAAKRAPSPQALQESVIGWLAIVSDQSAWDHADLALSAQVQLGHALRDRWQFLHDSADLDLAVKAYEATLSAGREELPYYHSLLADLAHAFSQRYEAAGDPEDLDAAVDAYGAALNSSTADVDWLESIGSNWALTLYKRYVARRDPTDLDAAIQLGERLVTSSDPETRAIAASNLGIALRARYEVQADGADLDASILAQETAISLVAPGSANWARWQSNLGNALTDRAVLRVDPEDARAALAAYASAADSLEPGGGNWAAAQVSLASACSKIYDSFGGEELLEPGIAACEAVLATSQAGSSVQRIAMRNLAVLLRLRFFARGDGEDVERGARLAEEAIAAERPGSQDWFQSALILGALLRLRYAISGSSSDIEAAIEVHEQMISRAEEGSQPWLRSHQGLGEVLLTRYKTMADSAELEAAIDAFRAALSGFAEETGDAAAVAASLAEALDLRFRADPQPAVVQEAVERWQQALPAVRPGSLKWVRWVSGLAVSLSLMYEVDDDPEHLDAAIDLLREVVRLGADQPTADWGFAQLELAEILLTRHRAAASSDDVASAQAAADAALQVPGVEPSRRAWAHKVLGDALTARFSVDHDAANLPAAAAAFREVRRDLEDVPSAEFLLAAAIGAGQAEALAGNWDASADDYGKALEIFEQVYAAQLLDRAADAWLREFGDVHARAAYSSMRAGRTEEAAVRLERGRARRLGSALATEQRELQSIRESHEALYEEFAGASAAVRALSIETGAQPAADELTSAALARRQARLAHDRLRRAIEGIRSVPGFEGFLAPPTWSTISDAVVDGPPVVYLAATSIGGLAVIARGDASAAAAEPVPLDDLTGAAVRDLMTQSSNGEGPKPWVHAYLDWVGSDDEDDASEATWLATVENVTRSLWDLAMGRVVAALAAGGSDEAVLIPVGMLGQLPFHAAWRTDPDAPAGRHAVIDDLAVSYAPSSWTLHQARDRMTAEPAHRLLAVSEPSPSSAGELPYARQEVDSIVPLFDQATVLPGPKATGAAVLEALAEADVAHFACHAEANAVMPLESAVIMADDEPLTVRDIMGRSSRGRLAVLSACETGVAGIELIDEVVGLPAALLQAGYAGVVASLWLVEDVATAMLMECFYKRWRQDGLTPARALRSAQLAVRDSPEGEFSHPVWWAAFSIVGA